MMSITTETAKLVVEHLKSIVHNDVEVRRSYLAVLDPTELDDTGKATLCVVPVGRDVERYTQGNMQRNSLAVDICINAKLNHRNHENDAQTTEIDALIAFAEKIYGAFMKKIAVSGENGIRAVLDQPEHVVLFDPEIFEQNCFLSVVRVNAEVFVKPGV